MFKLIVLISLGVSWIGLCIAGTGTGTGTAVVGGDSQVTKNVVIEPIETVHEGTPGDDVKRAKRGKNEPTLALLLTYHGNNCHKKQKASTSKFETIHITNGGSAKNVPTNNVVGKKLLESIVHTTSHSSSSGGDSIHKNQGDHAIQHKYQELLDQLNTHAGNEKCGCCGLNMGSCKNRNQQYVQLAENLGPVQAIEKHASILESIGSDSSDASDEDDHHHHNHHQHDHHHHGGHHGHHHHNDDDDDDSEDDDSDNDSYSHDDESNPVSFSISGESNESDDDSFDISDEHSSETDEHDIDGPVEHSLIPNTHGNYRMEYHPRDQMTHTIIPKPVKLRPKFQSQKPQPRILAGPHLKLKSKHFPHHSHLKPLYIETGSIYSDSIESDEALSHSLYSDEESLELPIETDDHGHRYKSVITHTLQANTKNVKQIKSNTSQRLSQISKFGCPSRGNRKTKL